MKQKFVDCFMLMNTALSLRNGRRLPEMGRPLIQDAFATFVNISLTIQSIHIADGKNMDLQLTALLNQKWADPRLNADEQTRRMAVSGQIWRPKIMATNGHSVDCPRNEDAMFFRGYGTGNILLSEKIGIRVSCTNHLQKFPFDYQVCQVKFGTYRFPLEEVLVSWEDPPVELTTSTNLGEFKLINVTAFDEIEIRQSGNYTIAVVQFTVKRYSNHYVYCTMLPSSLITILSYLAIWLDFGRYCTRYSLNVFSVIFLLYMYYQSLCSSLPVPYFKAIDTFVVMCLIFAIISLLQTFVLDILSFVKQELGVSKRGWRKELKRTVQFIESGVRIAYPVLFTFFLLVFCFSFIH